MSAPSKVAVIVISFNTRSLLLESVGSAFDSAKDCEVEVVVVDNASVDGSARAVIEKYPRATVISNVENVGFAAACNQGIKATRSQFILLLNSDARLTEQAFESLNRCFAESHRRGAAGCRLVDDAGNELVSCRKFLTPLNHAIEMAGVSRVFRFLSRSYRPRFDGSAVDCNVDWIEGACLMLRREALDQVGLFDERFFMYSEDEDLCLRLKEKGWLVCCASGTAVHHGAASTSRRRAEMLKQFYASQMLFLLKHRGDLSASVYAAAVRAVLLVKRAFLRDG